MPYLASTSCPRRCISAPFGTRSLSITVGGRCQTGLKFSSWIDDLQDRRLPIDLADDAGMARNDAVVLDRLDLGGGNVDDDVFLAGRLRELLQRC